MIGAFASSLNSTLILYLLSINYIACAGTRGLVYESVGKYSIKLIPAYPTSKQSFVNDYHSHDFTKLLHFA